VAFLKWGLVSYWSNDGKPGRSTHAPKPSAGCPTERPAQAPETAPSEVMEVSEASPLVNSPKNDGPQLLDPAA
jgi:putative SOS response-associated peptidase YedK